MVVLWLFFFHSKRISTFVRSPILLPPPVKEPPDSPENPDALVREPDPAAELAESEIKLEAMLPVLAG